MESDGVGVGGGAAGRRALLGDRAPATNWRGTGSPATRRRPIESNMTGGSPIFATACRKYIRARSETFVAQMLNLDLLDGISFSKGCYTGQEIIARTQHLGRIKRRLYRLQSA